MKKMSPSLINFSTMMAILSLPSILIVPITLACLVNSSNHIRMIVAVLSAALIIVLFFYFEDKATDLGYRKGVALNYAKKNKRAESVINPDTHKSVMSVIEKTINSGFISLTSSFSSLSSSRPVTRCMKPTRFMNLTTRFVIHMKQLPTYCFLMESSPF